MQNFERHTIFDQFLISLQSKQLQAGIFSIPKFRTLLVLLIFLLKQQKEPTLIGIFTEVTSAAEVQLADREVFA